MPAKWKWKKNCPNYYYENLTDFRKTVETGVGLPPGGGGGAQP